jgi:hypothetical protein
MNFATEISLPGFVEKFLAKSSSCPPNIALNVSLFFLFDFFSAIYSMKLSHSRWKVKKRMQNRLSVIFVKRTSIMCH